ncbi:hypothetical protein FRB99_001129 [Tulasnella sp. 403]|nr:hypothetical protein FRB99_001129 [Tulasnella sp. 403]
MSPSTLPFVRALALQACLLWVIALADLVVVVPVTELNYTGTWYQWTEVGGCGFYYWTNDTGATASVTFRGFGYSLTTPSKPTAGIVAIQDDGISWVMANRKTSTEVCDTGFSKNSLPFGQYTVTIRNQNSDGSDTLLSDFRFFTYDDGQVASMSQSSASSTSIVDQAHASEASVGVLSAVSLQSVASQSLASYISTMAAAAAGATTTARDGHASPLSHPGAIAALVLGLVAALLLMVIGLVFWNRHQRRRRSAMRRNSILKPGMVFPGAPPHRGSMSKDPIADNGNTSKEEHWSPTSPTYPPSPAHLSPTRQYPF